MMTRNNVAMRESNDNIDRMKMLITWISFADEVKYFLVIAWISFADKVKYFS